MGKESGKKVVVKVGNGATPTEVFTALKGQADASFSGSASPIDVSDKTTNNWGAKVPGTLDATVSVSGYPDWPDTMLDRLRTSWEGGTTVNIQLVINAGGDYYQGPFYVTQFDISGGVNDAAKYNITLSGAGQMTFTDVP